MFLWTPKGWCTNTMGKVPKANDVTLLLDKLGWVGTIRLGLSIVDRWWLNELGLYVQLRHAAGQVRLQAGGKYRSYFDAWGTEGKDFKLWEVRKYDKETWNRRFASMVWPTYEIAFFIGAPTLLDIPFNQQGKDSVLYNQLDAATQDMVGKNAIIMMKRAISHFKATGEWMGLLEFRCKTCSHRLDVWQKSEEELCPYCGGKMTV